MAIRDVLKIMLYLLAVVVFFSPFHQILFFESNLPEHDEASAGPSNKGAGKHNNGNDRDLYIFSPNWSRYISWLVEILGARRGFTSVVQGIGPNHVFVKEWEVDKVIVNLRSAGFGICNPFPYDMRDIWPTTMGSMRTWLEDTHT
jgi:hypothetical protein